MMATSGDEVVQKRKILGELEAVLALSTSLWWGWEYRLLLKKLIVQERYGGKVTALFCLSLISKIPLHCALSYFRNFSGFPCLQMLTCRSLIPLHSYLLELFSQLGPVTVSLICGKFALVPFLPVSALCSILSPFYFQGLQRSISY